MVNQYCAYSFARNWQLPFLYQRKGENDRRKYFMINLHKRMLPTSAGVEPATSWSPAGRRIQLSHWGQQVTLMLCIPGGTQYSSGCSKTHNLITMWYPHHRNIKSAWLQMFLYWTLIILRDPLKHFEISEIDNIVEKRRNCYLGAISPPFHDILSPVVRVPC